VVFKTVRLSCILHDVYLRDYVYICHVYPPKYRNDEKHRSIERERVHWPTKQIKQMHNNHCNGRLPVETKVHQCWPPITVNIIYSI